MNRFAFAAPAVVGALLLAGALRAPADPPSCEGQCAGDVNCDGQITVDDAEIVIQMFAYGWLYTLAWWEQTYGGPGCTAVCRVDLNGNGIVDFDDLEAMWPNLMGAGACCRPDGGCISVPPGCAVISGCVPQPGFSACLGDANGNGLDDLCEPPTGACCLAGQPGSPCFDGQTVEQCGSLGGEYVGDESECGARGACCLPGDVCKVMSEACCEASGGDFQGLPSCQAEGADGGAEGSACDLPPTLSVTVRGKYFRPDKKAYYLASVPADETLKVKVNWAGNPPGQVRWLRNNQVTWVDNVPGTTVTRNFTMGVDFGQGSELKVVAVAGNGAVSPAARANVAVVATPGGISAGELYPIPISNKLEYTRTNFTFSPTAIAVSDSQIPGTVPLFGASKAQFRVRPSSNLRIKSDGTGRAPWYAGSVTDKSYEACGKAWELSIGGGAAWIYSDQLSQWRDGGEIGFQVSRTQDVPPQPVRFLIPTPVGPIPAFWRGNVGIELQASLSLYTWGGPGVPNWEGSIEIGPQLEAGLGIGEVNILAVEGVGGGQARFGIRYPSLPTLAKFQVVLSGSIRITVLRSWATWEFPVAQYTWDIYGGSRGLDLAQPRMRILDRGYLDREPYAEFVANDAQPPESSDRTTTETPLLINTLPQSTPAIARSGDDLLLVWVSDDPNRTPVNRFKLVWSRYNALAQSWSPPASVADDGTADSYPTLASLPSGDVLLAWQDLNSVLVEPGAPGDACLAPCAAQCADDPDPAACAEACRLQCKFEATKAGSEISVARFVASSGTWTAPTRLSANNVLDRMPAVAVNATGAGIVTWVRNDAGDLFGSPAHPNQLMYATYDGVAWSGGLPGPGNLPAVLGASVALTSIGAVLVFAADTDGDLSTADDRELFSANYAGGSWGGVVAVTSDGAPGVEDGKPQLVRDETASPRLVWSRGGALYSASDLEALSDAHVVVDLPGLSGAADFVAFAGADGRAGVLWPDAGEDLGDLYYAVRHAFEMRWSLPRRLTTDQPLEQFPAATFDSAGNLVAAYTKRQMGYETRTVELNGEIFVLDNVPTYGAADLYFLRRPVAADAAIAPEDIVVTPKSPQPYTTAEMAATIHNIGDTTLASVGVAFYDGDPDSGGTLIGTVQQVAGPLRGGESATVSVPWLVPRVTEPRLIFVVVDPFAQLPDVDRSNNRAALLVLGPDLTVESIDVLASGPARAIAIRVINQGVADAPQCWLTLRLDAADGPILATLPVPALGGGWSAELSYLLPAPPPADDGQRQVWAEVDPLDTVAESDERNNIELAVIRTPARGDLNCDGVVDFDDIDAFVLALGGLHAYLDRFPDCNWLAADIDRDGFVTFDDIDPFVACLSGSCP